MKITIAGTGYVGLVTGVCLAEVGHNNVVCVDIDNKKVFLYETGDYYYGKDYVETFTSKAINEITKLSCLFVENKLSTHMFIIYSSLK